MDSIDILKQKIGLVDGKDYGAYQALKGRYEFPEFQLFIDQIPKDPYAPPHTGIYRTVVKNTFTELFDAIFNSQTSQIAFRDYLARGFYAFTSHKSGKRRGTGNSGIITITEPGQAILERNSVMTDRKIIEVRFFIGLPAEGRKINAELCETMLLDELPEIIGKALFADRTDQDQLEKHIRTAEDAEFMRAALVSHGLAAFIADGSILPRKSGTSDEPMDAEEAVPFSTPESLGIGIDTPHSGTITGMGIPKGVSLIVGGGFHGKTTLLQAIEMGIYNHIPGDGREKCVSLPDVCKVRAYSGRYIEKVNISSFISNLPMQKDTAAFSTENASGSTSQAASIMEAVECGASALLMDEDTCATNFMIRDRKMQNLIHPKDEPITPFIDRVQNFYQDKGISSILVLGGVGDYFDVSHTVLQMKNYRPLDVTERAHEIAAAVPDKRLTEGAEQEAAAAGRVPLKDCIDPFNEYNKKRIYATEMNRIHFGKNIIDLTDLEQLIELAQIKALGAAILYLTRYIDEKCNLRDIIEKVMQDISAKGLDILSDRITGNFARFRGIDLAFALNRLKGLQVK